MLYFLLNFGLNLNVADVDIIEVQMVDTRRFENKYLYPFKPCRKKNYFSNNLTL